jgi:hypothetical protein
MIINKLELHLTESLYSELKELKEVEFTIDYKGFKLDTCRLFYTAKQQLKLQLFNGDIVNCYLDITTLILKFTLLSEIKQAS